MRALLIIVILFSCQEKRQSTYQDNVKVWIKEHFDNPETYKPECFGQMIRFTDTVPMSAEIQKYIPTQEEYIFFDGYRIPHRFRVKNQYGVMELHSYMIAMDTLFNVKFAVQSPK